MHWWMESVWIDSAGSYQTTLLCSPSGRNSAAAPIKKGTEGIIRVFEAIQFMVQHAASASNPGKVELKNAAGGKVSITFAPDPDIVIKEEMAKGKFRNVVLIKVKGGTDFSNLHNRIREAEKATKRRNPPAMWNAGLSPMSTVSIWTWRGMNPPSTNRFYRLSALMNSQSEEYEDLRREDTDP
jgi:hypothetical protein